MDIKNKVEVIDNFIPVEYQNLIYDVLMGGRDLEGADDNGFPWYFTEDVTAAGEYDSQHRPALGHQYVSFDDDNDISEITSVYHHLFTPLLSKACHHLKIPQTEVIQGRSFLQFPLANVDTSVVDTPHIDLDEGFEHTVVLYYVVSSDGDTVIYNERTESDTYTVKQKVTPKQGRVVIFDGGQYHTAQQCKDKIRCIANYNIA